MYTKLKRDKVFFLLIFYAFLLCGDLYAEEAQEGRKFFASHYGLEACAYNDNPECPTASGRSLIGLIKEEEAYAASNDYPLGSSLSVCRSDDSAKCVRVRVWDRMHRRFTGKRIDLAPASFAELAPLEQGIVEVTIKPTEEI